MLPYLLYLGISALFELFMRLLLCLQLLVCFPSSILSRCGLLHLLVYVFSQR